MFSLLEDIENFTKLPFNLLNNGFRVINFSNKSVYVENYKAIISFENEEVLIKLPKGILSIYGKNLKINKLNLSCIIINGEINLIKVE